MTTAPLEVRNLQFDLRDVPKHWHGGKRSVSAFFDNLSIFFPAGERFFIRSVRAHLKHVKDEALLRDVKGFCGQEGMHGREHVRYNARIQEHGYPAERLEGAVERLLERVQKIVPRRAQLAATCALEHFTAILAHILLSNPRLLEEAHPNMAALWRWHAAEENEHKAVAYDVYTAAGGHYVERVAVMLLASVIFWAKVIEQQAHMMRADGTLWSAREHAALLRFLFVDPGGMRALIPLYLQYYKPGFHPWDLDNRDLLERWKQELPREYREAA
jgi:uncharacterized protein